MNAAGNSVERQTQRVAQAWKCLAAVLDPEIPVLSIVDLGIVRHVRMDEGGDLRVGLTPTYSGCPATDVIRDDVRRALESAGFAGAIVEEVLAPAWSSDDDVTGRPAHEACRFRHRPAWARRRKSAAAVAQHAGEAVRVAPAPTPSRSVRSARRPASRTIAAARALSPSIPLSVCDVLKFHALKVLETSPDAEDAVAIALEVPPALQAQYAGLAGQHVVVRSSIAGEELRRTYSLVNAAGELPLRIVPRVHAQGRMSRYLAEQLRPGDLLDVLPPNGSFTPRTPDVAGTYVAFAAGCGITPVLAIVRTLLARGAARVILFYGNSGTARTMCLEELLALKDCYLGRLSLHFVMSREPQEMELYNGRLDAARIRRFAGTLFEPRAVREYFVCGPGDMIEQVTQALSELDVDPACVHAPSISRSRRPARPPSQRLRQHPPTHRRGRLRRLRRASVR